ncbi:MAG: NupC/NupG family nucleoside CNT transporter [Candidatus Brocadiaceae bacterium]|nr:NupC/NupG family nucleoside CNT transporter [Candidatus Brocadiaceae bacterium]
MGLDVGYRFVSFGGLIAMLALAWALSENRRALRARTILWGLGLQLALALFVLKTRPGAWLFGGVDRVFAHVLGFSDQGAAFVFGKLSMEPSYGALVAFRVLPVIVFVASLASILYHLRVIQWAVRQMARLMQVTMRTSGAESLSSALFVFMGIESVTAVGKYVAPMTRSELFVVMTGFMATIASSVMATYVMFGASAGHLLAASLMSAPAAIVIAKIMVPETGVPATAGRVEFEPEVGTANIMDAAATGATDGVKLGINIAAMLIAFVALIAMVNFALEAVTGLTLQKAFGFMFAGFAAAMGVPRGEWLAVGELLGIKTVLNEFLAYEAMGGVELSVRARLISTYALCGFANLGSIAILIGGLSGVAPERRAEVAALGLKALVAGTLATFMTACYAGMFA